MMTKEIFCVCLTEKHSVQKKCSNICHVWTWIQFTSMVHKRTQQCGLQRGLVQHVDCNTTRNPETYSATVFFVYVSPVEQDSPTKILQCLGHATRSLEISTVIPRLTKIIRSGITFVSRNLCQPKRDFPYVSIENRLIRSGCCPLFKYQFYKIAKNTL